MATERKTQRPEQAEHEAREHCEDRLDEMVEESFPGSDSPSTWAGPDDDGC